MNERIDLYCRVGRRWEYLESTRRFITLRAAREWATQFWGFDVKARWSERGRA